MKSVALVSAVMIALIDAETPSNEQLANYGLTLPQFEIIKASESPYDFDHIEQDKLWLDAAVFSYEVSAANVKNKSSVNYMPYLVCCQTQGISGQERIQKIQDVFYNTSGVESTDFYHDNAVTNGALATCVLMRAYNDTMATIYGENAGVEEWLKVQPLHQSMKMNNQTVETLKKRFDNIASGDDVLPDDPSSWYKLVNVLGSQSLICPGVQNFDGQNITDDEIQDAVKNFIVENDGNNIREASFFHQRLNVNSSSDATTERMEMWAEIITDVDNMELENGTNYCRENIIDNGMIFKMDKDNLNVYAKFNTDEMIQLAENSGMLGGDVEKCALYLVMGLAINPMICWVEPKTQVEVLCPDGTSDLSKCPESENPESASFNIYGWTSLAMSSLFSVLAYT